jgi:general secretion pathway protein D
MLAGLIRDDERQVVSGVPGLIDIPLVGRLFAHNRRESQETDIVLTLTPRIVRVLDLTEDDLRPFRVGRAGETPLIELPIITEPSPPPPLPAPQQVPPAQQAPPPGNRPDSAAPIAPPQPTTPAQPPPPRQQ